MESHNLEFFDCGSKQPLQFNYDGQYYLRLQYDGDWFVRPLTQFEGECGVLVGGKFHALKWDPGLGGYRLPRESNREKEIYKSLEGTAGLLELFLRPDATRTEFYPLHPPLFTLAASVSQQDYAAMLDQIREAAVALDSSVKMPLPDDKIEGHTLEQTIRGSSSQGSMIKYLEAWLRLATVTQKHFPLIDAHPSRELRPQVTLVETGRASALGISSTLSRLASRPGETRVRANAVVEDFDTQENRFLYYVIESILENQGKVLARKLSRRAEVLQMRIRHPLQVAGLPKGPLRTRYANAYRAQRRRWENLVQQTSSRMEEIQRVVDWARSSKASPWLQAVHPNKGIPLHPSQRLLQSVDYGPIYQAYLELSATVDVEGVGKTLSLFEHYEERPIRSIDGIYELWLFFETYRILEEDFGFQPRGQRPIDALSWSKGKLNLPETGFDLVLSVDHDGVQTEVCQIQIRFDSTITQTPPCQAGKRCFDSRVCTSLQCYKKIMEEGRDWNGKLRPDIWITVRQGNMTRRFALDAKYRSYNKLCVSNSELKFYGVDNTFDHDVIGIAKMKYLDALGCDASFVLHTDQNPEWTFFGEQPFQKTPSRQQASIEGGFVKFGNSESLVAVGGLNVSSGGGVWPGHRFGAVCVTPSTLGNLHKVLKCILMYHSRVTNICWNCRKRMTATNGGAQLNAEAELKSADSDTETSTAPVVQAQIDRIEQGKDRGAVYYLCPDCKSFWILQRCLQKRHPLIKLGSESFHSASRTQPEKTWVNLCPECGSDLPKKADDEATLSY